MLHEISPHCTLWNRECRECRTEALAHVEPVDDSPLLARTIREGGGRGRRRRLLDHLRRLNLLLWLGHLSRKLMCGGGPQSLVTVVAFSLHIRLVAELRNFRSVSNDSALFLSVCTGVCRIAVGLFGSNSTVIFIRCPT